LRHDADGRTKWKARHSAGRDAPVQSLCSRIPGLAHRGRALLFPSLSSPSPPAWLPVPPQPMTIPKPRLVMTRLRGRPGPEFEGTTGPGLWKHTATNYPYIEPPTPTRPHGVPFNIVAVTLARSTTWISSSATLSHAARRSPESLSRRLLLSDNLFAQIEQSPTISGLRDRSTLYSSRFGLRLAQVKAFSQASTPRHYLPLETSVSKPLSPTSESERMKVFGLPLLPTVRRPYVPASKRL